MSGETRQPRRGRIVTRNDTVALLALIGIILAVTALVIAYLDHRESDSPFTAGNEITVEQANAVLERANDAAASADTLLSFLEVFTAVAGVILAAGAWLLRRSILEQVEKVEVFARRTDERFAEREQRLDDLEHSLTERLADQVRANTDQFDVMRQQAESAFRVVSLQLLAEQQVRAHNIDTAIHTLTSALAIDPDNQASNYLLGYLYTARKQFDQAVGCLEHALEVEPGFGPAQAALGLALRRKGDSLQRPDQLEQRNLLWADAEHNLLEALTKDGTLTDADGESYYGTLGGLYRRQGRYPDAVEAYEKARKVTPDSSYPIINLATLYTHQGDEDRARHYFELVLHKAALQLDDDPRDAWTRVDLSQALLVLGKSKEALKELQTVIDQEPESSLLETVRSGLQFLTESPRPIRGLDVMLTRIDNALAGTENETDTEFVGAPDEG